MRVPRVMCVTKPLKVVIENYPEGQVEELDASYYPHDVPLTGSRKVPFSRELYIERDDFMENPSKKFYRLAPNREVRLRYGYFITCTGIVKDSSGEISELRCTYDPATRGGDSPDGRKVQGTIHWVSVAQAIDCDINLYDKLFTIPDPDAVEEGQDFLSVVNPESLVVIEGAKIEPSVGGDPIGSRYQFERTGYFVSDPVSQSGRLTFNRTVTLRDSWAKIKEK
jgi:glutaminyl-tRNA synthetase